MSRLLAGARLPVLKSRERAPVLAYRRSSLLIVGANKVFPHDGKEYHIQVEDLGTDAACLEVRVYVGGAVLWRKQVPYKEVLDRSLPQLELEEELRGLMDKTIHTVQAGIAKGKIG